MNGKQVIMLRGLGGNFKSSIAKELVASGYAMIPEGNREFEKVLNTFDRQSDTELNYCAKYIVIKGLLGNNFEKYVSDRGLIDYALMNEFVNKILLHFHESWSPNLNLENVFKEECSLLNGYSIVNVLLMTTDKGFLKKIIDDAYDVRACFYDNSEDYLQCQEIYKNFILEHYDNVIQINLDKIPDADKYSDEMNEFVTKLTNDILNKINNDK